MKALGEVVTMWIDMTVGGEVSEGDVIQTQTGRSYRVLSTRLQERPGKPDRYHFAGLVVDQSTVQPDDKVIPFYWYKR